MKRITLTVVILSLMALGVGPATAQSGHDLFQQALLKERAEGELREAIQLYEQIVRDFAADRTLAARALVQVGQCYEKLGSTEAERAYRRVVSEFADQAELVAEARSRLAALRSAAPAPSRGPVARRVLSGADTDTNDFVEMTPSLDGRRLAYINQWDGGVYVRDLTSGDVQKVASAEPEVWHYFPEWSPDGRRVAVTEQKGGTTLIKLIDVATREAVTAPGTETQGWIEIAEWSRDGRFLLCDRNERLALIAVDDGTMTVLADSVRNQHGSLSPDGRFVSYAVGEEGDSHIFVQPLAGGPPRQITWAQGENIHPVWSPDGRAIAYKRDNGIWVVPVTEGEAGGSPQLALLADGFSLRGWTEAGLYYTLWNDTGEMRVPYQVPVDPATGEPGTGGPQVLPASHPEDFWTFSWAPDMQRVAFVNPLSPEIAIYSADQQSLVTYDLGLQGHSYSPWWSADGQELLYQPVSLQGEWREGGVVALDVGTGNVRVVVPPIANVGLPFLSADGRRMVFNRFEDTGSGRHIAAVVVAETGQSDGQVVATRGGPDEKGISRRVWPRLSPEGDRVLFVRAPSQWQFPLAPDASALWVVASNGSGARRLATAARILSAVWDPSGRFIAYTGMPEGNEGSPSVLRVVEVATGVERDIPFPTSLAKSSGLDLRVAQWSPDGRFLGIVTSSSEQWEYWVVQGLMEGER